jgi:hypothetical protein
MAPQPRQPDWLLAPVTPAAMRRANTKELTARKALPERSA